MFTQLDICGIVHLHAGLPIFAVGLARSADEREGTQELVTDLVTNVAAGAGYQTNRKGDMLGGAACKKPNVLSPIW